MMEWKFEKKLKEHSLGVPREKMPQIDYENLISFLIHFTQNAKVSEKKLRIGSLKPTQAEIYEEKIIKKIKKKDKGWKERCYIVSKEKYLLDGHHDWAYGIEKDENCKVKVFVIDVEIGKLLNRANKMNITYQEV